MHHAVGCRFFRGFVLQCLCCVSAVCCCVGGGEWRAAEKLICSSVFVAAVVSEGAFFISSAIVDQAVSIPLQQAGVIRHSNFVRNTLRVLLYNHNILEWQGWLLRREGSKAARQWTAVACTFRLSQACSVLLLYCCLLYRRSSRVLPAIQPASVPCVACRMKDPTSYVVHGKQSICLLCVVFAVPQCNTNTMDFRRNMTKYIAPCAGQFSIFHFFVFFFTYTSSIT